MSDNKVVIVNLCKCAGDGLELMYSGPSVREAVLSMAQDIMVVNNLLSLKRIFDDLKEGVDYKVIAQ